MGKLTVLVLADVECAWCKKVTGKKFINSDNRVSQIQIKNDGRLISHGICKSCQDDLLADTDVKHRACI